MSKKRRDPQSFPPDIFWISPEGKTRSVIGHLSSIRAHPEAYGIHAAPETNEDIQEAFDTLFREGWVRGRWSGDTVSFQMERPRGLPMSNAFEFVLRYHTHISKVEVDFWDPAFKRMAKEMTASEFVDQKFPKHWGLGDAGDE